MIHGNTQRYWLFTAVAPATDHLLHIRLLPTSTQALTEMFLAQFRKNVSMTTHSFWSMTHRGCRQRVTDTDSDSSLSFTGIGMLSNASSKNSNAELRRLSLTSDT